MCSPGTPPDSQTRPSHRQHPKMFSLALLTLSTAFLGAFAIPTSAGNATLERRAATVYTRCTVPNTVALTFVSSLRVVTREYTNRDERTMARIPTCMDVPQSLDAI